MSVPHRIKLAWALAGYLQAKGYTLTHLINPNPVRLPPPPIKGNTAPDVVAKGKDQHMAIGLALVPEIIPTPQTRDQLIDFSTRFHKDTKQPVEFFIGIEDNQDAVALLKRTFGEVHVDWKNPHIHIVKLTF